MVTGLPKENLAAKLCKADFVDCLDLDDKITPVLHSVEPGVREFDTKIVPMNILVLMPEALKGKTSFYSTVFNFSIRSKQQIRYLGLLSAHSII